MLFDLTDKRVWVAGQHGMVGSAMTRRLEREGCALLRDPGRPGLDLRRQSEVEGWIASRRPQVVVLTAGRVGGLCANDTFPADFLYDNLLIEAKRGYDEPGILSYAISSFCPTSADGLHPRPCAFRPSAQSSMLADSMLAAQSPRRFRHVRLKGS